MSDTNGMTKDAFLKVFYLQDYSPGVGVCHARIIVEHIGSLPEWHGAPKIDIIAATTFAIYGDSPQDWFSVTKQTSKWSWTEAQSIPPVVPRYLKPGEVYLLSNESYKGYTEIQDTYILSAFTRFGVRDISQQYNIDSDVPQVWLIESLITYTRIDLFVPANDYTYPNQQRDRSDGGLGLMGKTSMRFGNTAYGLAQFQDSTEHNLCIIPAWAVGYHEVEDSEGHFPDWSPFGYPSIGNLGYTDYYPTPYTGNNIQYNDMIAPLAHWVWLQSGNDDWYSAWLEGDSTWDWRTAGSIPVNPGVIVPPLPFLPIIEPILTGGIGGVTDDGSSGVRELYEVGLAPMESNDNKDGWLMLSGSGMTIRGYPVKLG